MCYKVYSTFLNEIKFIFPVTLDQIKFYIRSIAHGFNYLLINNEFFNLNNGNLEKFILSIEHLGQEDIQTEIL